MRLQPDKYNENENINGKYKRILQIKRFKLNKRIFRYNNNYHNDLLKLMDKIGENVFFDIICKEYLYPWEILNLFLLSKKCNFVITSYDKKWLYFQNSIFLNEENMKKYLLKIENMIDLLQNELTHCHCKYEHSRKCDENFWTDLKKCLHSKLFAIEFETFEAKVLQSKCDKSREYYRFIYVLKSMDYADRCMDIHQKIMNTNCSNTIFEQECNRYVENFQRHEKTMCDPLCTVHNNDRNHILKLIGFMAVKRLYYRIKNLITQKKNVMFVISVKAKCKDLFDSIFLNLDMIKRLLNCAIIIPHCNMIHWYEKTNDVLIISKTNICDNIDQDDVTLLNLSIDI